MPPHPELLRIDKLRQLIMNWLFIQEKTDLLTVQDVDRLATWIDTRLQVTGE